MKETEFRGKRVDNGEFVFGDLIYNPTTGISDCILERNNKPRYFIEVIPETVGQLRYKKNGIKYFDGDVYYHAGYGLEEVSDLCEIQYSLMQGTDDDICDIKGNIYDNPELIQ